MGRIAKAVLTPDGCFASTRLAAAHYNVTYNAVHKRIRKGRHGWGYAELPPLPVITLASKPRRKLGPRRPKLSEPD
jgi:hypothetical protein